MMGQQQFSPLQSTRALALAVVCSMLVLLMALVVSPRTAFAQATIASSAAAINVARAGVVLTNEQYWQSAVGANLFVNPGFELPQFGQTFAVSSATSSSIT